MKNERSGDRWSYRPRSRWTDLLKSRKEAAIQKAASSDLSYRPRTAELENRGGSSELSGTDYELLCASMLERLGWSVELTRVSGDFGADLIATKDSRRIAIQCKRYAGSVGVRSVQEALMGKSYYDALEAVVISTGSFTNGAITAALKSNIKLLHHDHLHLL